MERIGNHPLISHFTTDADREMERRWLQTMSNCAEPVDDGETVAGERERSGN